MCFSHNFQRSLGPGQLPFGPFGAGLELGVLDLLSRLLAGRAAGASPASAPLSRALRHSLRCEEYSPSRRSSTPRATGSAASYSVRMSSLYLAVNDRRRGRSDRGLISPFSDDRADRSAANAPRGRSGNGPARSPSNRPHRPPRPARAVPATSRRSPPDPAQPGPEHLTRVIVDATGHHRSGVHIQPDARTLSLHRDLPQLLALPARFHPAGNPRQLASEVPAQRPGHGPGKVVILGVSWGDTPVMV